MKTTINIQLSDCRHEFDTPSLKQKYPFRLFCNRATYTQEQFVLPEIEYTRGDISSCATLEPKTYPPEEIIFRVLSHWKVAGIETLSNHTGCGMDGVRDAIRTLISNGGVVDLGRISGRWADDFRGNLYGIKYGHEKNFRYEGDLIHTFIRGYRKSSEGCLSPDEYPTSRGYVIRRHLIGSAYWAGKLVKTINEVGDEINLDKGKTVRDRCWFAYSEHVLRSIFGWYNPYKVSQYYEKCPQLYRTHVPDAWLVGRFFSCRVEYFRSKPDEKSFFHRLFVMPEGEMMVAIIESPDRIGRNSEAIYNILKEHQGAKLHIIQIPSKVEDETQENSWVPAWKRAVMKNITANQDLIVAPSSFTNDPEDINIYELAMHLSQGGFLQCMRKKMPTSHWLMGWSGWQNDKT